MATKTRTYEFYKVGYKAPGETEYTFYNEPVTKEADALDRAVRIAATEGLQTCAARFTIIHVCKPDET